MYFLDVSVMEAVGLINRQKKEYTQILQRLTMEKTTTRNKVFNPEKYGMVLCPDCKGCGKLLRDPNEVKVCATCGGSGVMRELVQKSSKVFQPKT